MRRPTALALVGTLMLVAAVSAGPAFAQDETTTTTTSSPFPTFPPVEETTTTTEPTTTTTDPDDPGAVEELPAEPVPVVAETVPPRAQDSTVYASQAGRILRQQLRVAEVEAVELAASYDAAKQAVVALEAELDGLELSVAGLAESDRAAVRRVEVARRQFEARAANAVIRGGDVDFRRYITADDPNELVIAQTLLDAVLDADDVAVAEYVAAKAAVDGELVRTAERLVDARLELEAARSALVDARRASVASQFNLAVFAAGSEIVINGFTFPVGEPHSFGDSFGAPRMMGTAYEHAHQGTDIMAPFGTPLFACERGIVTKMGSDVLGGNKIWVKGESGTYYYYAHLSGFAEGMVDGKVVNAGEVIGYVGDSGNAKGGAPHVHFEIRPDGGAAVNPYPLLKVVDDLAKQARGR